MMSRYLKKSARPGRSDKFRTEKMSDLPRCADSQVAWHLLDRRSAPSSKEGDSRYKKVTTHRASDKCVAINRNSSVAPAWRQFTRTRAFTIRYAL